MDPGEESPSAEESPNPALPSDRAGRLARLLAVLRGAAAADGRRLLLLTHRSPDPDALGALVGLDHLLRRTLGLDPVIATGGRIFRAENMAMVRELELAFEDYEALEPTRFWGVIVVDAQPTFGHTVLPAEVPVLAVFDHHEPQGSAPAGEVPHADVRLGIGATSSIVYEYLTAAKIDLDHRVATALCCGIRFDTADLSLKITALDEEAFFECFRRADRRMLARITQPSLPPTYYRELHRSLSRARKHGPLVFGLLGRVKDPESVAEMADFFLRLEGAGWSLVGGEFEGVYHLSLRTDPRFGRAFSLLERVLDGEGSFGGRGTVAGGQIPLESGDEQTLARLERRLRARALGMVDAALLGASDPRRGTRLTRLP
ncbi:MAG: DHH family phosphoesterase [Planctomycetota bacterium]